MSDTFLPGSGFDTYEQQDKVLVGLCGGTGCKAAVRILQQQGFAVMGAVVRLCTDDPVVDAAKEAAKALGIECITLNASELASQLAEETAAPADLRFPALLAAADRLGIQYIATGHRARVETGAAVVRAREQGVTVLPLHGYVVAGQVFVFGERGGVPYRIEMADGQY